MDVPDFPCSKIGEDGSGGIFQFRRDWLAKSSIEAIVAVWGDSDMRLCIKDNLPIHCQTWECPCSRGMSAC